MMLKPAPAPEAQEGSAPLDLQAVYRAEFAYVWRTLRRLGVKAEDLEDLAHDVFVVVHRRAADYDPARPLKPWLFGIAYRVASESRRRTRPAVGTTIEPASETPGPEEALEAEEARELLMAALDELELEFRAVVVMHDVDGIAAPEIARVLGIPLNTVYSRLRLARGKLAVAVKRVRAKGAGRAE